MCGPDDVDLGEEKKGIDGVFAAGSVSTYPVDLQQEDTSATGGLTKLGAPICDYYCAEIYEMYGRSVLCMTDGCNWGEKPMKASQTANYGFHEYMRNRQHRIADLRSAAYCILKALEYAQASIIEPIENVWEAGSCTLMGGIVLKLTEDSLDRNLFVDKRKRKGSFRTLLDKVSDKDSPGSDDRKKVKKTGKEGKRRISIRDEGGREKEKEKEKEVKKDKREGGGEGEKAPDPPPTCHHSLSAPGNQSPPQSPDSAKPPPLLEAPPPIPQYDSLSSKKSQSLPDLPSLGEDPAIPPASPPTPTPSPLSSTAGIALSPSTAEIALSPSSPAPLLPPPPLPASSASSPCSTPSSSTSSLSSSLSSSASSSPSFLSETPPIPVTDSVSSGPGAQNSPLYSSSPSSPSSPPTGLPPQSSPPFLSPSSSTPPDPSYLSSPRIKLEEKDMNKEKEKKEVKKNSDLGEFVFMCVNIGDCKAYIYRSDEKSWDDISRGNRINISDPCDPGGRIGPYLDYGQPDIRNLAVFCSRAHAGDIVVICSDGIHDNLDPEFLGYSPEECSLEAETWEEVDFIKAEAAKAAFTKRFVEQLLSKESREKGCEVTPQMISNTLLRNAQNTTINGREWLGANPGRRLPCDYSKYPGKMDHSSILCLRVGETPTSLSSNTPPLSSRGSRK